MTPNDLEHVQRSWSQLRWRRPVLVAALADCFAEAGQPIAEAARRADWLVGAVDQLVWLLPAPSRLAATARELADGWPDPLTAPSFAVEGLAWMEASRRCLETWSDRAEDSWRQAWLLLADVLAAETLSPFADGATPDA
jgi:hypothetical protein